MCEAAQILLSWYDQNARVMPWRIGPTDRMNGVLPDPYHVWLSEVMLQQTTVAAVKSYFEKFVQKWPKVGDLAKAADADVMAAWAGLGYYARARNLLKCARFVSAELGGRFPETEAELQKLPGIGPYTSAAIASIAFDRQATVLDGNVERVMARMHNVQVPLPDSKEQLRTLAADWTPQRRPGDYAQAVMDLGATICTPKSPSCGICPWSADCVSRAQGVQADLPRKRPKAKKPIRVGVAYVVARADGAVLLEQRPDRGLLGGMLGWPSGEWAVEPVGFEPPVSNWIELSETVRHTFTHFQLHLSVRAASVSNDYIPSTGHFVPLSNFRPSDLPTVMRKVWDLAEPELKG